MRPTMPPPENQPRNGRTKQGRASGSRLPWAGQAVIPGSAAAPKNKRNPRNHPPGDPLTDALPALKHFFTVAGVLLVFCAIPYVHKSMADYRYLDLIDASPLVRAVTLQPPRSMKSTVPTVPAVGQGEATGLDGNVEALMPQDPSLAGKGSAGGEKAENSGSKQGSPDAGTQVAMAADAGKQSAQTPSDKPRRADPKGRDHPLLRDEQPEPAVQLPTALVLNAQTFGDQKTFIEDPDHKLDPFYKALMALAYGERDKVRVRHYGDSHLANDGITHAIRVMLQRRFGDGGHGFTLVAARTKWYKHKGVSRSANDGWKARNFLGSSLKDGAYGYGGVAALGQMGSVFNVATARRGDFGRKATSIELWFRGVAMGRMKMWVDGTPHIQKVGKNTGDRWKRFDVKDGPHKFKLKVESGWMRLFGVALERDKGLVYDSLGVVGARASRWRNANAVHLKAQFKKRPTDLLVVNYGGNSRNDKVSEAKYIARYKRALELLRVARPDEPCLVIGPTEHGKRKRGKVINDDKTTRMIAWQRTFAKEAGCAFFNAREWMAEVGDMNVWVKRKLVWHDMAHLTPRGQSKLGHAVYRAYLKGLAGYMQRHGDGLHPKAPK